MCLIEMEAQGGCPVGEECQFLGLESRYTVAVFFLTTVKSSVQRAPIWATT